MSATDLDPNFLLPIWRALVRYYRAYPPLVHSAQQLELPLRRERRKTRLARGWLSLSKDLERRMPLQPSP
jgi:hypothetical protein